MSASAIWHQLSGIVDTDVVPHKGGAICQELEHYD